MQGINRLMRRRWVYWTFWFAMLGVFRSTEAVCYEQDVPTSKCENSTVDEAWGPKFASRARGFLTELQKVVRNNDKSKFSSLVHYPVSVCSGNSKSAILNAGDLKWKYKSIMTPEMKQAILTQSSECLFANGQGVMIGSGEIWFQQFGEQMRIITFNLGPIGK